MIHSSATVDTSSVIGPNVVIGANCVIGPGCKIYNSTILADTKIAGLTLIEGSIIGWKCKIGKWVRINGLTVLGEDVELKDECYLNGTMILPHKAIATNYPTSGTIVM